MGRGPEQTLLQKRTDRWPIDMWKDAQRYKSSEKRKLKLQWDITSYLSEWLSSINKQTTSVGEDVDKKRTHSRTFRGNAGWRSHYGKQCGGYLKFKVELPYDPVLSLLGIYPKKHETLIQKIICTPMIIAALFTIAKIWKQPSCLSIDKCIKKKP